MCSARGIRGHGTVMLILARSIIASESFTATLWASVALLLTYPFYG